MIQECVSLFEPCHRMGLLCEDCRWNGNRRSCHASPMSAPNLPPNDVGKQKRTRSDPLRVLSSIPSRSTHNGMPKSCPTRIRTWTNRIKICCATVTPSGKAKRAGVYRMPSCGRNPSSAGESRIETGLFQRESSKSGLALSAGLTSLTTHTGEKSGFRKSRTSRRPMRSIARHDSPLRGVPV